MSISRVALVSPYYNYSYTSLYKDKKSLLEDLQMFYRCFISIKEVAENHLTSFITEGVHYLIIIELDVIDLKPPLVSRIDSYKHLISRI